eukprot:gene16154-19222_t
MKGSTYFALFLVLLAASSSALEVTIYEGGEPGDFDFYLFVQQWIYSYCGTQTCIASKEREAFTIHGLWPENNGGSYPSFCKGPAFNANEINDLLTDMNYDWPSLTGPNDDFWTHEWSKHGTCSLTGPITDEHDYFSSALKLYSSFNITDSLVTHGIFPSNSGSVSVPAINSSLKASFGGVPLLQCSGGELSTVAICITKETLEVMDCPALSGWNCNGASTTKWPATISN